MISLCFYGRLNSVIQGIPVSSFVMQSFDDDKNKKKKLKLTQSFNHEMPVTDATVTQTLDSCVLFPVEEIVQYPLPGYVAPASISFSPDDNIVTYLFSPDHTLNRKVFAFNLKSSKQELIFSPPDGGLDESNISPEEKLRRERLRERGLGVTRYEWLKTSSKKKAIMVPLPAGVCTLSPVVNCCLLCYLIYIYNNNCFVVYTVSFSCYTENIDSFDCCIVSSSTVFTTYDFIAVFACAR